MKKSHSVNKKSVKPKQTFYSPKSWWKVSITFKNSSECRCFSLPLAVKLNAAIPGIMLYFARYMTVAECRTDLYFLLPPDRIGSEDHVRILLRSLEGRTFQVSTPIQVEGSMAHALGFEVITAIYMKFLYTAPDEEDNDEGGMQAAFKELADVTHWMSNMLGLDYCDESKLHLYSLDRIVNIFQQSIKLGNKLTDASKRLEKTKTRAARN